MRSHTTCNPYIDSSSSSYKNLAQSFADVMLANMLQQLKDEITPIMYNAHQPSLMPSPAMNEARKIEMKRVAFGTTLNSLQRAYSKLLHETFESQWSSEVAANVRNLADAVVWKLTANLTFLDNSRSVALPQIAPAVYMMGVVSKAATYQLFS